MPGSVNIDLYGSPDIQADARSLPYADASVDWLEAHHLLEHFDLDAGQEALREWARVIKPGGHVLISVPDLQAIIGFMTATRGLIEPWRGLVRFVYGQPQEGMRHKSGYSPEYLVHCLEQQGFGSFVVFKDYPKRPTPSFGVLACRL